MYCSVRLLVGATVRGLPRRWRRLEGMEPDTAVVVAAIAAGTSALAAIVTAVVAVRSLAGSRRDSRDRTRPVIVAQLKRAPLSPGTLDLVLSNYGATSAKDVQVRFDPPLPDPSNLSASDMRQWIGLRYARTFSQWPPGMTLSNVYRAGHDAVEPVTVTVSYQGQDGTRYRDSFELDPDALIKETQVSPSSTTPEEKRVVSALEAMARALDRRI